MADVNNVNGSPSVYEQINQANQNASTQKAQSESDSDMFMKLMIAQLQNQDPTSPADTNDFMQQISSMSQVESINKLTQSVENMSAQLMTSQAALQASSMVGQKAYINTQVASIGESDEIRGVGSIEGTVDDMRVSITDLSGNVIDSWSMGSRRAGDHEFVWKASEDLPKGSYRVVIEAAEESGGNYEPVDTFIAHTVNSVTLGQNGVGMRVNTDAGSASINDIKQIA